MSRLKFYPGLWPLLMVAAISALGLGRADAQNPNQQPGAVDPQMQREIERYKQQVAQRLGRKEDGFFVVAFSTTQYVPADKRATRFVPKTTVLVEKAEGRGAAIDKVIEHMTKKSEAKGPNAGSKRDWLFVGRYETSELADRAGQQAQMRFSPPVERLRQ